MIRMLLATAAIALLPGLASAQTACSHRGALDDAYCDESGTSSPMYQPDPAAWRSITASSPWTGEDPRHATSSAPADGIPDAVRGQARRLLPGDEQCRPGGGHALRPPAHRRLLDPATAFAVNLAGACPSPSRAMSASSRAIASSSSRAPVRDPHPGRSARAPRGLPGHLNSGNHNPPRPVSRGRRDAGHRLPRAVLGRA